MTVLQKTNDKKIDSARVHLRPLRVEDVTDNYVQWLNDPDVNAFLEVRHQVPISKQDVTDFVNQCQADHRYHWGIFVDGGHVGNVSCSYFNERYRWADISNLIGEERYRGTNVAKLAFTAAVNYLFSVARLNSIQAGTCSVHFSGITLLTNCGFKKEAVLRQKAIVNGEYVDVLKFGILKQEWEEIKERYSMVKVTKMEWES